MIFKKQKTPNPESSHKWFGSGFLKLISSVYFLNILVLNLEDLQRNFH